MTESVTVSDSRVEIPRDGDFFIPQEEVDAIDPCLRALGLEYALENYEGAVHGFCCEERSESYHPEAARDAWSKLEGFLAAHLRRT